MSRNNKILLLLAILLLVLNIWLFFFDRWSTGDAVDRSVFMVTDSSQVDRVIISSPDEKIQIQREPGYWTLQGNYKADEGLRRLFFSILKRVRVRKPVDIQPSDSIEVILEGDHSKRFLVFSNPTKTRTYFYDPESENSYEVEIPGYNEYLGGIFELTENQWRDRLIMDENWRSIKSVQVDYSGNEDDLSINFNDEFFSIVGVTAIDSSFVVDYLNQFQYFEVNEFISPRRFPKYDSLSKTAPLARFTISSIRSNGPRSLNIFPAIESRPYHLITNDKGELMVLDSKRVDEILRKPADFKAEE